MKYIQDDGNCLYYDKNDSIKLLSVFNDLF